MPLGEAAWAWFAAHLPGMTLESYLAGQAWTFARTARAVIVATLAAAGTFVFLCCAVAAAFELESDGPTPNVPLLVVLFAGAAFAVWMPVVAARAMYRHRTR
ncbi:MAG TPA: hypothetical protein VMV41_05055 [Cellulomonadaceae bacterium]|nr:hypothetical protein [Cellulomonadaceae bacterium]